MKAIFGSDFSSNAMAATGSEAARRPSGEGAAQSGHDTILFLLRPVGRAVRFLCSFIRAPPSLVGLDKVCLPDPEAYV